ncbi:MAG: hypothetical protein KIT18_11090 [Burkholderiales bacterium]|nr:hypothetical protein [Burkholderiales bacterium]
MNADRRRLPHRSSLSAFIGIHQRLHGFKAFLRRALVISTVGVLLSCGSAKEPDYKKYDFPLQLPELFEARLLELGVSQPGIDYLKTVDECVHWMGEEPYDAERKQQIAEGMKASCARTESLRQKYLDTQPAEMALKSVLSIRKDFSEREVFSLDYPIWKDPERTSQVMSAYYESHAQNVIMVTERDSHIVRNKTVRPLVDLITANRQIPVLKENIDRLHPATRRGLLKAESTLRELNVPTDYE